MHAFERRHLIVFHFTQNVLACNFMHRCNRQFPTIELLHEHVKVSHSAVKVNETPPVINLLTLQVACKCDMISCRGLNFPDTDKLITHFMHFHDQEARECLFEGCDTKFQPKKNSTVRYHILLKHKRLNKMKLKSNYKL